MLGACLVKAVYALPTWTRVGDLIAEHPGWEAALGGAPSHWRCYASSVPSGKSTRAASTRSPHPCASSTRRWAAKWLSTRATSPHTATARSSSTRGGPERQVYSDPDASLGHRSAVSTRKGGGYGYRIHAAVCTKTALPLAWQVETARSHESNYIAPLLDAVRAHGFAPRTAAMDMGYANGRIYAECAEREVVAIIPLRKNSGVCESSPPRKSDE